MPYPGISAGVSNYRMGAGTYNAVVSGAGVLAGLLAFSDNAAGLDTVVIHDSLNAATAPNPLLTVYVGLGRHVDVLRPYAQGLYFASGLSLVLTGSNVAVHLTTHVEVTP